MKKMLVVAGLLLVVMGALGGAGALLFSTSSSVSVDAPAAYSPTGGVGELHLCKQNDPDCDEANQGP